MDVKELFEFEGGPMGWWAKGHHEPAAFLAAVELARCEIGVGFDPVLLTENVRHTYWRVVPTISPHRDNAWVGLFIDARGPGPGAFAVTVVE